MRTPLKLLAASIAIITPIALGWAYTAGASVGEDTSMFDSIFGEETEDQFSVDDYLITRESTDGVVTMQVQAPDGTLLDLTELPADIAERVAFYETEWTPPEGESPFGEENGQPCYIEIDLSRGDHVNAAQMDGDTVLAYEASVDDDGNETSWAFQFSHDELSPEDHATLESPESFSSIEGGTPLPPCGG